MTGVYRTLCFACGREIHGGSVSVWTADPQMQYVGPECAKYIRDAGPEGYQPSKGGPRLYWTRVAAETASRNLS